MLGCRSTKIQWALHVLDLNSRIESSQMQLFCLNFLLFICVRCIQKYRQTRDGSVQEGKKRLEIRGKMCFLSQVTWVSVTKTLYLKFLVASVCKSDEEKKSISTVVYRLVERWLQFPRDLFYISVSVPWSAAKCHGPLWAVWIWDECNCVSASSGF